METSLPHPADWSRMADVDGHRKLPTGGHLWRILWPWFLPAYGQIVPHLL